MMGLLLVMVSFDAAVVAATAFSFCGFLPISLKILKHTLPLSLAVVVDVISSLFFPFPCLLLPVYLTLVLLSENLLHPAMSLPLFDVSRCLADAQS